MLALFLKWAPLFVCVCLLALVVKFFVLGVIALMFEELLVMLPSILVVLLICLYVFGLRQASLCFMFVKSFVVWFLVIISALIVLLFFEYEWSNFFLIFLDKSAMGIAMCVVSFVFLIRVLFDVSYTLFFPHTRVCGLCREGCSDLFVCC